MFAKTFINKNERDVNLPNVQMYVRDSLTTKTVFLKLDSLSNTLIYYLDISFGIHEPTDNDLIQLDGSVIALNEKQISEINKLIEKLKQPDNKIGADGVPYVILWIDNEKYEFDYTKEHTNLYNLTRKLISCLPDVKI